MDRTRKLIVPVIVAVLASPVFAGGAECAKGDAHKASLTAASGEKCSKTAQQCREYLSQAKTRWVGLELDKDEETGALTVLEVHPTSPAAKAGFHTGDVLVAMNGVAINDENQEKLAGIKKSLEAGDEVLYKVERHGSDRFLTVTLGTMPDKVLEVMTAEHMKHHQDADDVATR